MITTYSRRLLAASMLALAACRGKKTPTGPTTPTSSISVATGSATLTVAQSASESAALSVTRTNYTGDVTLSAEGLPTGVTATFTPTTLTAGGTTSTVAFAASGTAAAGTSTVTVRARGTGVTDATTTIGLTVTASTSGTVSLALTPAASTITAGQTAVTTLAITRGSGFTGGVNLTLTGAPSGLNFSFSSANPVTANSVTVTMTAATSVVPGPYTLTMRANAAGLTEATTSYVLTVNPVPSNAVSWRYCNADRLPLWFAYLDGTDGTWQRVTPTNTTQFDFNVGQPTVGVAAVYNERGVIVTDVRYYGLTELTAAAAAECVDSPASGTKSLSGSVTGIASANESVNVSIGGAVSSFATLADPTFAIARVPTGPRDLVAVRVNASTNSAQRILLQRNTNFADGTSIGTLDLASSPSFAPATGNVTITAPNDGTLLGTVNFTTATGSGASLPMGSISSGAAAAYPAVPDALLQATDIQRIVIQQTVGTTLTRSIERYIRGPAAVTMSMPSDPGAPTVTSVVNSPYPRASATGSVASAFNRSVLVQWDPTGSSRRWVMSSTLLSRGNSLNYTLTMPDFSTVPGWNANWQLGTGTSEVTSRFLGQTGANASGDPIDGTVRFAISRKTSFTF